MADTNNMVHVAQSKLQQLVGQDTCSVCKTKKAMIGKDGSQAHSSRMKDTFMAETTQTRVSMNDLDAFSNHDVSEYREEGKHRGHGSVTVDDKEGYVVDLQPTSEVSDTSPILSGMCDHDDFVAAIYEFLRWESVSFHAWYVGSDARTWAS